ncbi:hypothetical protein F4861DRAFT_504116 [Xylaria intraflava]|nr:hypothetical protein F4861DRAFT_504116 [Xylaria intraflava]
MNRPITPNHTCHEDADSTAVRGASLAFQRSTARPATTPASNDGALIAATSASRDHSLARSPSPSHQTTANNGGPGRYPDSHRSIDPRSPSRIAATLAASRSSSPTRKAAPSLQLHTHQAGHKQRKGLTSDGSAISSGADSTLTTDSNSIGPTNATISFFEQKATRTDPIKKTPAVSSAKRLRVGLPPLTPPRTMSPVITYDTSPLRLAPSVVRGEMPSASLSTGPSMARPSSSRRYSESSEGKQQPPAPPARKKAHANLPVSTTSSNIDSKRKGRPVTPPPKTIRRANTVILSPQPRSASSQKIIKDSLANHPGFSDRPLPESGTQRQASASRTDRPQVRSFIHGKKPGILVQRSSSSSSNDSFVSASSAPLPQLDPTRRRNPDPLSSKVSQPLGLRSGLLIPPSRPLVLRQNKPSSQIPLNSLTNAIVAGSLASARATPSVARPRTPPSRKPTPRIRQTLRAPRAKSEELLEVRPQHRKKPLGKLSSRKKHAHHEGSRKRWREEITPRERQRYEGVWASNRGLLLDNSSTVAGGLQDINTTQLVANAVVRDIWARSRLPFDELAEVWDLVDTQGKGVLDKSEFVVGMWLIDQRLRGRKIPSKVSDSVWGSAKGVRVPVPKGKK